MSISGKHQFYFIRFSIRQFLVRVSSKYTQSLVSALLCVSWLSWGRQQTTQFFIDFRVSELFAFQQFKVSGVTSGIAADSFNAHHKHKGWEVRGQRFLADRCAGGTSEKQFWFVVGSFADVGDPALLLCKTQFRHTLEQFLCVSAILRKRRRRRRRTSKTNPHAWPQKKKNHMYTSVSRHVFEQEEPCKKVAHSCSVAL